MSAKTIRLLMPQWQGGNNPDYGFGARLLAWLAPSSDDLLIEVPVDTPATALTLEDGIFGRASLLRQMQAAEDILADQRPERVVVFGGDCLVDLAPFAYLSQRYGNTFGVLWIDAHPDVATPNERQHGHTMVLGSLLGEGDAQFAAKVGPPLAPERVMLAGLGRLSPQEAGFIERHNLPRISPAELASGHGKVLDWITSAGIQHLAIHLDLDVLDPTLFRALSFGKPPMEAAHLATLRTGQLNFADLAVLIAGVSAHVEVVGLGITEYLPWDALNLKNLLGQFPILGGKSPASDQSP